MNLDLKCMFFLTEILNTDKVSHSGRTLWDHLRNTAFLLRMWGKSEPVVLAGLFHSIYGTTQFKTISFPIEGRLIISNLIGRTAEQLVYEFCSSNRSVFPWGIGSQHLVDLYTIEAANLIEQGSRPGYVKRLADTGILGVKVTDACMNYVNSKGV